ncbi:TPA: DegT/DnrJ/EryC1/StrS family aminotransferase [Candidatus Poribacteria bacterium]|nr:DegT/DnrJ/EryC1/StrS family aminotransferase [Candidatus Poribacteria bacterium]
MNPKDTYRIPLAVPTFDKEMENAALNALHNERFVLGEDVYKFEEEFAKYVGAKYAVSTNSGTAALHLSLLALGIKSQEHVITTSFSFIATANAILHANATPVFSDINIKTYNIDPSKIRQSITKHTKVILPVHLYGYPCDMQQIMSIAKDAKVKVLEDACQAHGAEYNGLKVGTIGDVGCFSFYPSKNMTVCGDGGMIVTNNEEIARMVIKLRDCGRKTKYEHDIIGYTARLNTLNAAIGRIQLKRLNEWNEKRVRNALLYNKLLSDLDEIVLPLAPKKLVKPVYHLYVIRARNRDKLKEHLENNGIQCGVHYPLPIHLQPVYKKLFRFKGGEYPISELVSQTCLSLPMHPSLTKDDITYVCEKIHEFYEEAG